MITTTIEDQRRRESCVRQRPGEGREDGVQESAPPRGAGLSPGKRLRGNIPYCVLPMNNASLGRVWSAAATCRLRFCRALALSHRISRPCRANPWPCRLPTSPLPTGCPVAWDCVNTYGLPKDVKLEPGSLSRRNWVEPDKPTNVRRSNVPLKPVIAMTEAGKGQPATRPIVQAWSRACIVIRVS